VRRRNDLTEPVEGIRSIDCLISTIQRHEGGSVVPRIHSAGIKSSRHSQGGAIQRDGLSPEYILESKVGAVDSGPRGKNEGRASPSKEF
jgi:hypothetical protein